MLNTREIVLYVLYKLGGWQKRVHTEDIAMECFKLTPTKFSWIKYPNYPDTSPVYYALGDNKKPKYGSLVIGESERGKSSQSLGGWRLTPAGIKWIKANIHRIEKSLNKSLPEIGDRLPAERKLKELLNSVAFKKYKILGHNTAMTPVEFCESLTCTINAKPEILNEKLEQFYSISDELNNKEVKKYIIFCRNKFKNILNM